MVEYLLLKDNVIDDKEGRGGGGDVVMSCEERLGFFCAPEGEIPV